ncbi:MAG: hypothetical protein KKA64_04480 [Nanoarchaeota archaeon]|nr:hypothetical protein [Nanoarchaeota archaeon]
MTEYLALIASQFGISIMLLVMLLVLVITWSAVWKLIALWTAARNNSKIWFIVLAIVNTLGILEILYIFVFSKCCKPRAVQKPASRKRRR